MPRTYTRKAASRQYKTAYTKENIQKAMQQVKRGVSQRKAAEQNNVPQSTLSRMLKNLNPKKPGGQVRLSLDAEEAIVEVLDTLMNWRLPFDSFDLRLLVKDYLDRREIVDRRFKQNTPGIDWANNFMKRHNLTQRLADNVKAARVGVTADEINEFFDNLEISLKDVPAENIFNFDETNFADNPKPKRVIVKRGKRRVETKIEHSKQSFSVMFCGSAAGVYLPPMVIYKAKNRYTGWEEGGIPGAKYDATDSGWFDLRTFERWYFEIFLPHAQNLPGIKFVIGDNLQSHFSPEVIASCLEHNIVFSTLVPNATHLLQVLDVAVFRPLKRNWAVVLFDWRKESRKTGSIPKEHFPQLLYRVVKNLKEEHLIAGFKACGIYPLDRTQVLKRLPGVNRDPGGSRTVEVLNDSVISLLHDHCGIGQGTSTSTKKRGTKIGTKIVPGRRIVGINKSPTATSSSITATKCPKDWSACRVVIEPTPSSTQSTNPSRNEIDNGDVWLCRHCEEEWDYEDDNRWIVCDICDERYHLQCSGLQYEATEYNDIDLKDVDFYCDECDG